MFAELTPVRKLMLLNAIAGPKAVEYTASGNPCVFETNLAKPLKRLSLSLLPRQSGTGDPSPENIRPLLPWGDVGTWTGGKNLLNVVAENAINYGSYNHYTINNGNIIIDGSVLAGFKAKCNPLTTYTYSIKSTKKTYDLHLRVYGFENEPTSFIAQNTRLNEQQNLYGTFTTQANDNWLLVGVYVSSELGAEGLTISDLQLEVGETATAYVPYSPITPHPVNLRKNLYPVLIGEDSFINNGSATHGNENGKLTINTIASSSSSGVYLNPNSRFRELLDDVDGQTVTLSLDIQASENASVRIVFCGKQILFDVTPSTRRVSISETVGSTKNLNIYGVNSGATLTVSNVQLEQGEQATAFQPYLPPVYGCSVDLTTGEVWGTYGVVDMGTLTWAYNSGQLSMVSGNIASVVGDGVNVLCSNYKTATDLRSVTWSNTDKAIAINKSSVTTTGNFAPNALVVKDTDYSDAATFKTAMSGVQLVYELATPVLLATLTPQQINALVGVNTVWSDADGIELTYLKKG